MYICVCKYRYWTPPPRRSHASHCPRRDRGAFYVYVYIYICVRMYVYIYTCMYISLFDSSFTGGASLLTVQGEIEVLFMYVYINI